MIRLLLLFGLIFVAVLVIQRYLYNAPPGTGRKLRRALLFGGLIFVLLMVTVGRANVLLPILGGLIASIVRLLPVLLPILLKSLPHWQRWRRQQGAGQYTPGGNADASTVESRYLRMRLDHASGEIFGEVLAGRYAGRELADLDRKQLIDLYEECVRGDPESATLLRAYMERIYGETGEGTYEGDTDVPSDGRMTSDEAFAILGLEPGANREEIVAAHRRLMQKLHPDRGGSDYLAAKINQAKDLLLNR